MRYEAEVLLETGPDTAAVLRDALGPEAGRPVPRTRVDVGVADDGLTLHVASEDASALRAALNSLLRFARTALDVHDRT